MSCCFRYWIMQFPMHFDMENGLAGALKEFQSALTPTSAELVDLSQVPTYDWMRHVSVRHSHLLEQQMSLNKQHSRKVSLVFNHLEPIQLAEHITYLEHKVIRRITVSFTCKYKGLSCFPFISNLQLAEHIAYLEHKVIRRITVSFTYKYKGLSCFPFISNLQLAEHITYLEHKVIRGIKVSFTYKYKGL